MATTWAVLLPSRGPAVSRALAVFAGALAAAFLAAAAFWGLDVAAASDLPPLAVFWPLGAAFFECACFFDEAFSGATCAPLSATAAVISVSVASEFVMFVVLSAFCASAHDDSSLCFGPQASELCESIVSDVPAACPGGWAASAVTAEAF